MVKCPVCDAVIDVEEDELDEGESVTCDECGAELRVAGLDPFELVAVEEDEDDEEALDYDEDEDEDEEEEDESWK